MRYLLSILFLSMTVLSQAQSAIDIIRKTDEKLRGKSNSSEMKMTIVRPEWKREITMKGWSLGTEYSIILITAPARDKGQAFLKRDNEMWNWQPTIDRVIKLPPSMMLQSWMGSDFTNDDLVKESSIINDYTHVLVGDSTINGMEVYKIALTPKPDAAVVWGKIITFIDKVEYNQHLVYYYDEDNFLINTMVMSDLKMMGGKLLPAKMEMIPADEPENRTIIEYIDMQFDIGVTEDFFSLQNTKRVR